MIRLLRKELAFHWRRNRRSFSLWLLVLLSFSTGMALILWRDRWRGITQQQIQQIQSQRGLLELRVNQHRTTALDWGHWDTMHAFAAGEDPQFVARELQPSSIVADRQFLMVFDSLGRPLTTEPVLPLSETLRRCIEARLQRLRRLTPAAPMDASFGFYCRDDDQGQVLLGAGTGIRPSQGGTPERGWVIHMSALERPSYNSSLNQTFREIDSSIALRSAESGSQTQPDQQAIASISELLEPGKRYVMQPRFPAMETAREAAAQSIPGWLAINLIALSLVPAGLLVARQRRLPGRIRTLQDLRAERKRRHQISRMLMSRRHLLMTLDSNPEAFTGCWLAAVRVEPKAGRVEQGQKALQNLALVLDQRISPRGMTQMDQQTLVLAFSPPTDTDGEPTGLLESLQDVLNSTWPEAQACRCGGLVAPLQAGDETEQLLSLYNAATRLAPGTPLQIVRPMRNRADGSAARAIGPGSGGRPGPLALATPEASGNPVVQIVAGQTVRLYSPIRTRPDPDNTGGTGALAEALTLLRSSGATGESFALPITAGRLEREGAALTAALSAVSRDLRRRLVLEVAESMQMVQSTALPNIARDLKELAVQITISDFGNSHVPLQAAFRLEPTYLKLSAEYTRSIHQDNIDSLVDFLLSYCRYKQCTLVLQGVETLSVLQYWQRKGVQAFQGPACG